MTEEEFAQTLYCWFSEQLNKEEVIKVARRFNYGVKNKEYSNKIRKELFRLNIWLIIFSCEKNSSINSILSQCLNTFQQIVFENYVDIKEIDYASWLSAIGKHYIKNIDVSTGSELHLASTLAKHLRTNLFGFISRNPYMLTQIIAYVKNNCDSLQYLIDKFINSNSDYIKIRASNRKEVLTC